MLALLARLSPSAPKQEQKAADKRYKKELKSLDGRNRGASKRKPRHIPGHSKYWIVEAKHDLHAQNLSAIEDQSTIPATAEEPNSDQDQDVDGDDEDEDQAEEAEEDNVIIESMLRRGYMNVPSSVPAQHGKFSVATLALSEIRPDSVADKTLSGYCGYVGQMVSMALKNGMPLSDEDTLVRILMYFAKKNDPISIRPSETQRLVGPYPMLRFNSSFLVRVVFMSTVHTLIWSAQVRVEAPSKAIAATVLQSQERTCTLFCRRSLPLVSFLLPAQASGCSFEVIIKQQHSRLVMCATIVETLASASHRRYPSDHPDAPFLSQSCGRGACVSGGEVTGSEADSASDTDSNSVRIEAGQSWELVIDDMTQPTLHCIDCRLTNCTTQRNRKVNHESETDSNASLDSSDDDSSDCAEASDDEYRSVQVNEAEAEAEDDDLTDLGDEADAESDGDEAESHASGDEVKEDDDEADGLPDDHGDAASRTKKRRRSIRLAATRAGRHPTVTVPGRVAKLVRKQTPSPAAQRKRQSKAWNRTKGTAVITIADDRVT